MYDEFVLKTDENTATVVQPVRLDEAGLREREHPQEWVLANPVSSATVSRSSPASTTSGTPPMIIPCSTG